MRGHTYVLDLGANVDSSAAHLVQFAVMGSVLAELVLLSCATLDPLGQDGDFLLGEHAGFVEHLETLEVGSADLERRGFLGHRGNGTTNAGKQMALLQFPPLF